TCVTHKNAPLLPNDAKIRWRTVETFDASEMEYAERFFDSQTADKISAIATLSEIRTTIKRPSLFAKIFEKTPFPRKHAGVALWILLSSVLTVCLILSIGLESNKARIYCTIGALFA